MYKVTVLAAAVMLLFVGLAISTPKIPPVPKPQPGLPVVEVDLSQTETVYHKKV